MGYTKVGETRIDTYEDDETLDVIKVYSGWADGDLPTPEQYIELYEECAGTCKTIELTNHRIEHDLLVKLLPDIVFAFKQGMCVRED